MRIQKPKMIIFDYGHTLLYEIGHNSENGNRAIYQYIKKNPKNIAFPEFNKTVNDTFDKLKEYRSGIDINERDFLRLVYEYMDIELSVSLEEAERIIWNGISKGDIMPKADKMLDYLNDNHIRTAVISNMCWSGKALKDRFDRVLPNNKFEFVMTSSEYILKKPNQMLFEIALNKAGLKAEEVWYCGDSIKADVYGAHSAGIFPVLYEGETEEENPFAGQNEGYEIDFDCLKIKDWDELIEILKIIGIKNPDGNTFEIT